MDMPQVLCACGCGAKFDRYDSEESMRAAFEKRRSKFRDTSIEIAVQKRLIKKGIVFEKHKYILGQPDIFILPNICIFVDGCYWHSCKQCSDHNKFNDKQRARIIKDELITQKLTNDGYKVMRFWEHDIKKDVNSIIRLIEEEMQIAKNKEERQEVLKQ